MNKSKMSEKYVVSQMNESKSHTKNICTEMVDQKTVETDESMKIAE